MKKNDVVSRQINLPIGEVVLHNCSSPEIAKNFMENDFFLQYGVLPTYELKLDLETSQNDLILTSPIEYTEQATVMWVFEGEVSIQQKDGSYRMFMLVDEPEWIVAIESVASYQSSVENLTDEDLEKAIEDLRSQRSYLPERKAKSPRATVDKNDPMAVALASMPEDKKIELMKKLGMID